MLDDVQPRQLDIDDLGDDELARDHHDLQPHPKNNVLRCLTPFQAILKALGKNVEIRFA